MKTFFNPQTGEFFTDEEEPDRYLRDREIAPSDPAYLKAIGRHMDDTDATEEYLRAMGVVDTSAYRAAKADGFTVIRKITKRR